MHLFASARLLWETLLISGIMLILSALPLFSERVRRHAKLFFLLGTGALTGLLLFDLLPDLVEMGGRSSLLGAGIVWAIYSLLHLSHVRYHKLEGQSETQHVHHHHGHGGSLFFFLASMISHCVASGMLLVLSDGLANQINRTVFLALLAHKGYEALTVSSIMIERQKSRSKALVSLGLYSLSLPAGVIVTLCFRSVFTQSIALVATSLAVGSLLGCLMFDFLIPSFSAIRTRRYDVAWVAVGLLLTQLVMRTL